MCRPALSCSFQKNYLKKNTMHKKPKQRCKDKVRHRIHAADSNTGQCQLRAHKTGCCHDHKGRSFQVAFKQIRRQKRAKPPRAYKVHGFANSVGLWMHVHKQ